MVHRNMEAMLLSVVRLITSEPRTRHELYAVMLKEFGRGRNTSWAVLKQFVDEAAELLPDSLGEWNHFLYRTDRATGVSFERLVYVDRGEGMRYDLEAVVRGICHPESPAVAAAPFMKVKPPFLLTAYATPTRMEARLEVAPPSAGEMTAVPAGVARKAFRTVFGQVTEPVELKLGPGPVADKSRVRIRTGKGMGVVYTEICDADGCYSYMKVSRSNSIAWPDEMYTFFSARKGAVNRDSDAQEKS